LTFLPTPPTALLLAPVVLLVLWFTLPVRERERPRTRRAGCGLAVLLALGLFVPWPPAPGPWVAFLDVGQGDATVIHASDGTTWLVDVGDNRGPGDAARNAVLPFLRRRRIRRLEGVVLSHRHRDHVGGLATLLETVPVTGVYGAGFGGDRGTSAWVDSVLAAHDLVQGRVFASDTLRAGSSIRLVVLHPTPRDSVLAGNLNNVSVVLRYEDGPLTVLLPGDLEREGERRLLARRPNLEARVLKVGHHGSATSSTETFLEAIGPELAAVSCGVGNRYGHPNPETLGRLTRRAQRVHRTDLEGSLTVRPGRSGELEMHAYPPEPLIWDFPSGNAVH